MNWETGEEDGTGWGGLAPSREERTEVETVSLTNEYPTVDETLRFLRKHEQLQSDGAKLIHVKQFLAKALKSERVRLLRELAEEAESKQSKHRLLSEWLMEGRWAHASRWLRQRAEDLSK